MRCGDFRLWSAAAGGVVVAVADAGLAASFRPFRARGGRAGAVAWSR